MERLSSGPSRVLLSQSPSGDKILIYYLALTESKGLRALKNWSLSKLSPQQVSMASYLKKMGLPVRLFLRPANWRNEGFFDLFFCLLDFI